MNILSKAILGFAVVGVGAVGAGTIKAGQVAARKIKNKVVIAKMNKDINKILKENERMEEEA